MSSFWNSRISVSMFGEAHGPAIGVTVDNLPSGEYIDAEELARFMARRYSGGSAPAVNSMPHIMSGIFNDRTTGTPLCAFLQNTDTSAPQHDNLDSLARPGHADYTGTMRYRGFNDVRDGGHFSDRLTAPLCFAGAVCAQILERRGIYTGAHILQIHNIKDNPFDPVNITRDGVLSVRNKDFPVINDRKGWAMIEDINKAHEGGESLGGVIECAAVNVPAGIGSPIFDGLENNIAQLIFGIPNVRGLEFGAGFLSAKMVGSQNNDEFYVNDHGHVLTKTNNHGGILGGISSGMPITLRVAFKPSEYVAGEQNAVNYRDMTSETIESVKHIPCSVPAAVPCVEAAVNIALLSHMLDYPNFC
ncbi:chorismate synthase [Ruminococcus flavefaciens]|uniref:chorismate synthase n=1 Tax=Ruminococcus flavefaciens TaxID=1265 RepID=UPI0026EBEC3D|nr:chorismate synthase [Ruminococcus flavefaciens]